MESAFRLFVLILFCLVAAAAFYLRSPGVRGRLGEARVASYLRGRLPEGQFVILSDLTLPSGDGTTQIDHIVLGRNGVFVIETKNMSGWIFGAADQARWTQVIFRRKSRFQNPVRQNYLHVKTVQAVLKLPQSQLHNLVVFAGSAVARTPMPENVLFGERSLGDRILSSTAVIYSPEEIASFSDRLLKVTLERNRQTRVAHVAHLRNKVASGHDNGPLCPVCSSPMKPRTQRATGQAFLGCSKYPKCKGTLPLHRPNAVDKDDAFDVLE